MVTLYKHQQDLVDQNPRKWLLAHDRGTGKTITALALAKKNGVEPLIIVPKQVRKKWHYAMVSMGVDGTIMSRDQFRRDAKNIKKKYDALIIDECHRGFGSLQAQMHKQALGFIKHWNIEYVWLLTGTPYTSSPWSVYGIAKLLGHSWDYQRFRNEFFYERWFGSRSVWQPRGDKQEELAARVRAIGNVVRLDECADIPDQTYEIETFEPTKEQRTAEELVIVDESNPLVRTTKYHQIASGIRIGNEFVEDITYACDKNTRIVEYAEDTQKLVVFSRYNLHLYHLKELIEDKKIPCAIINGKTDDKEAIIARAEASERFVLLINAACSEGYELPSFDTVIFASLSYSYVDFSQACGRVLRINNLKKNLYIIMLTEGSIDEVVWDSIEHKRSFNDAIFSTTMIGEYETRHHSRNAPKNSDA